MVWHLHDRLVHVMHVAVNDTGIAFVFALGAEMPSNRRQVAPGIPRDARIPLLGAIGAHGRS
jgi:hypothetical protein